MSNRMLSQEELKKKIERRHDRKQMILSLMEEIKSQGNKNKNMVEMLQQGYITFKKEHKGYTEFMEIKERFEEEGKKMKFPVYFGKWQYFFIKGDMIISLIKIRSISNQWKWEIFAFYDDRLFDDTMSFRTKAEALEKINQLLGD